MYTFLWDTRYILESKFDNIEPKYSYKNCVEIGAKTPGAFPGSLKLPAGSFFVCGGPFQTHMRSAGNSNLV